MATASKSSATLPTTVGLIAGGGQFPLLAAQGILDQGRRLVCVLLKGHVGEEEAGRLKAMAQAAKSFNVGQLGGVIAFLRRNQATHACFAGAVSKPKALAIRPDLRAVKALLRARTKGDDSLLRSVIRELESEGLTVVQAADFVPDLRAPHGVLTSRGPSPEEAEDIAYARRVMADIGRHDIGQCLVVKRGMVVAVEAMEGTDACIARAGTLGRKGPGGMVALKSPKPGQDRRVDLPALGPTTVAACRDAGVSCLAFVAGGCLFFDLQDGIEAAEAAGLCLVGLAAEGP